MNKDTKILKLPILPQHIQAEAGLKILGVTLLLSGFIFFLGFFYVAILSKLLPSSGNQILSAIQNDRYYCLLVPVTLPVLVVAVYFHWLSMKAFKHA